MNKGELVKALSKKLSVSNSEAKRFLEAFLAIITSTLKSGGSLILVGFGTFLVKKRSARTARNPRTGEPIHIASRWVPFFKPGSKLRKAVEVIKKKRS